MACEFSLAYDPGGRKKGRRLEGAAPDKLYAD